MRSSTCSSLVCSVAGRFQERVKHSMLTYNTTVHLCAKQVREGLQQAKAEAAASARAQAAAAAALLHKEPAADAPDAESEPADTQVRKQLLRGSMHADHLGVLFSL